MSIDSIDLDTFIRREGRKENPSGPFAKSCSRGNLVVPQSRIVVTLAPGFEGVNQQC